MLFNRFLDAIKQYLCLSLLKNTASTLLIIFQLSCSIFVSLVSRFRAGLKAEIGVFFPMIILRVLENVAQPNFQQKIMVLRCLQKLCGDSQIMIDIFLNYDCDVNASNIFERYIFLMDVFIWPSSSYINVICTNAYSFLPYSLKGFVYSPCLI